jgi:hypothetical protein
MTERSTLKLLFAFFVGAVVGAFITMGLQSAGTTPYEFSPLDVNKHQSYSNMYAAGWLLNKHTGELRFVAEKVETNESGKVYKPFSLLLSAGDCQ